MWAPMFCVPPMEYILTGELLLTHTQTSLLYASPTIMIVALAIPAGIVADKIGVQKAVGIGVTILAVGSMLRGIVGSSLVGLLGSTFVYGIGIGWLFPTLPKLVSHWLPRESLGVGTGIYSVGMFVGTSLPLAITIPVIFPLVGNFQGVFLVWGIPSVVGAILWWALAKRFSSSNTDRELSDSARSSKGQLLAMLKNKNLLLVLTLFFLHQFFVTTWLGWTPTLMLLKGTSPELAGLISSVPLWIGIPVGILIPRLFYKIGARRPVLFVSSLALVLLAGGALLMNVSLSWLVMALSGIAITARFITMMMLPAEIAPKHSVGTASGLMLSIGYVGGIIGPLIGGYTFDLTGGLDTMLFFLIATAVPAVIISRKLPEIS